MVRYQRLPVKFIALVFAFTVLYGLMYGGLASAAWCTFGTDCTGAGGRVGGADWNNARAAAMKSGDACSGELGGTFPNCTVEIIRQAATDCTAETGGITKEICEELDDNVFYICETGPCNGSGWVQYGGSAGVSRQAATDCTAETGGITKEICEELDDNVFYVCESGPCNGSGWVQYGGGGATRDTVFDNGKVIDGANSEANAVRNGDGTDYVGTWCASNSCHMKAGGTITDITIRAALRAIVNTVSANYTIGTDDTFECYGGQITVDTTGVTVTACAIAAGMWFTVDVRGAISIDLDPNGTDQIRLNGAAAALTAGNRIDNTGVAGGMAVCVADEALVWNCHAYDPGNNPWTDGGA